MVETYSIFPLGDSAITLDLGERIDEELNSKALAIREWLAARPIPGMQDIIVGYSSVTVFYDPVETMEGLAADDAAGGRSSFDHVKKLLDQAVEQAVVSPTGEGEPIRIPVCYGGRFGPDLEPVSRVTGISPEEIMHLHGSQVYRVYMIGFLPGFPYLGKTDPRLNMPRKAVPVPVPAGSIGIVGTSRAVSTRSIVRAVGILSVVPR